MKKTETYDRMMEKNEMEFDEEMNKRCCAAEEVIRSYLPAEEGYQKTLIEAMNYSIRSGGKRLRPMMMYASAEMFGTPVKMIEPFMAAIEMIHTYSLVHDDLAAMDNDEYRRGKRTTHAVYGEGMGVLAGDGLLNYAFETALKSFDLTSDNDDKERCLKALKILADKAGIYGMAGGQGADIESDNTGESSEELLMFIHEHKTAAMIQSAMMIGAVLQGASDADVSKIEESAYHIGIAFQIRDDILDVTSSLQELGKPVFSDEKNNKTTYVTLYGMEKAEADVQSMSDEALDIIKSVGKNEFLEEIVLNLIHRNK